MGMPELLEAFRLVEEHADFSSFAGPRDPALVSAAESALGGPLPPTYREFVARLGAGSFGESEFYGVTGPNFESGRVPNGIWLTLKARRQGAIPPASVVVGATGDGGYYCVDLLDGEESPVVLREPGAPRDVPATLVCADFGSFLLQEVRSELSGCAQDHQAPIPRAR